VSTNTEEPINARPIIDFTFIAEREGENACVGYIAVDNGQYSGVCVGIGCNLGKISHTKLRSMALNPALLGKLYPYVGLIGQEAADYLLEHPLELSLAETDAVNLGCWQNQVNELILQFEHSSQKSFCELSKTWQTVLFSLSIQVNDLAHNKANFWSAVTNAHWDDAKSALRQFSPREAHYIEANI
jgi:hypothetical protein